MQFNLNHGTLRITVKKLNRNLIIAVVSDHIPFKYVKSYFCKRYQVKWNKIDKTRAFDPVFKNNIRKNKAQYRVVLLKRSASDFVENFVQKLCLPIWILHKDLDYYLFIR